jgi:MFS family permease
MARLAASLNRDSKIIGLVCFPHMMSHFYYMVLPPMFSVLKAAFAMNSLEFGTVLTAFALTAGIGQTPVGFLVDRVGGRPVLVAGLVVEAVAIGAIGLADSYWQLVALGAVAGIGHTVFHPADFAILTSVVNNDRMGRAFGFHSFTGVLGFAAAPIFMTGIYTLWSWQAAFLAAGAIGLLAALLVWANGALLDEAAGEAGGDGASPAVGDPHSPHSPPSTAGGQGIRLLFTAPIMVCFVYYVLHQMGIGGLRGFLEGALSELYGTPQVIAAAALTGIMSGAAGGILVGGYLADRTGPQIWVAVLTLVPAGLLIAAIGMFDLPAIALIAVITMAGFLMGVLVPSRDMLLRSVTPAGSMGKVMGFASTGANFGGAMIPIVLGWVMDNADPRWIFWITAAFVAGAMLTFITVRGRFGQVPG